MTESVAPPTLTVEAALALSFDVRSALLGGWVLVGRPVVGDAEDWDAARAP